jgi:hypothetical protein
LEVYLPKYGVKRGVLWSRAWALNAQLGKTSLLEKCEMVRVMENDTFVEERVTSILETGVILNGAIAARRSKLNNSQT